jgi:hypothetical protein
MFNIQTPWRQSNGSYQRIQHVCEIGFTNFGLEQFGLEDAPQAASLSGGLAPQSVTPFDFRSPFYIGGSRSPLGFAQTSSLGLDSSGGIECHDQHSWILLAARVYSHIPHRLIHPTG